MKFDCVSASSNDPFMITWDLGRRCNYDCTYCAPIHHDNFSPHASLEELKKTADFIFEYITLIAKYRTTKDFHLNLTGGEPTNNPNFLKLMYHLQSYKEQLKDMLSLYLTLTTNGTMGKRTTEVVGNTFDHITVSYHAEADAKLKQNNKDTDSVITELNEIKKKRNEISNHVNTLSANATADELTKYLERRTKGKGIKY